MAETVTIRSDTVDRQMTQGVTVNWELVAWVGLLTLTLLTRLWALGDRAMSHDESLHTYYSWNLFMGRGYTHDPMMHGPLLFHGTALSYFLFGVSDFTARLLSVVTGLALVASPLLLRKWLGSAGALAAGLMLLVSPTVMYYSRYIRHDIPVELFTVLMAVSFFRYIDGREGRWIVLALAAAAGAITSAEMSYINGFVLVSFIAVVLVVERMTAERADLVALTLGALGLGLLLFATVVHEAAGATDGLLVDVRNMLGNSTQEGSTVRIAMQMSFLFGGIAVIYSLVVGLIAKFHSKPTEHELELQHEGAILADFLPQNVYRDSEGGGATIAAVGGLVAIGVGALLRWAALAQLGSGGGDAATGTGSPAIWNLLSGLGIVAITAGVLIGVVGFGALLWSAIGRAASYVISSVGIAVAAVGGWLAVEAIARTEQQSGTPPIMGANIAFALAVLGGIVAAYGLLAWVLEDYEERRLAAAIATAPANAIGTGLGVFAVIYVLLFTTFFTNPSGIDGFFESIRYWLAQHDVQRGDQPWYYYALITPMYEFLPMLLAMAATLVYSLRRDLRVRRGNDDGTTENPTPAARYFVPMLIAWAAGNFWIYSWAGEKMPWLTVHLVVPMAILAGRLIGDLVAAVDWADMRRRGWQIVALTVLLLVAAASWLSRAPLGDSGQSIAGWIVGLPIVFLIVWAFLKVAEGLPRSQVRLAVSLALALVLFAVNTRYSLLANFVNDELATEYIVYAHGTPDDKLVYETLLDMQERLGVDAPLSIAFDDEVSWPFTWYFRDTDWYKADYIGKDPSAVTNQDVVLIGEPNRESFHPYLRDRYVAVKYRRMWWPNEGYKNLTLDQVWTALTDAEARRNWIDIVLYREYDKPLTDWYHHANMWMYVKQDLVERVWPLVEARPDWARGGTGAAEGPSANPVELQVDQRFTDTPEQPIVAPKDIAVAEDGSVFVVDHQNARIAVFEPDGTFRESIGEGELRDGDNNPSAWGIAIDGDTVYVADTWNHRIVAYRDGQRLRTWGEFGQHKDAPDANLDQMYGPRDLAVGPDGNLYVTDTGNSRVLKFSPQGEPLDSFGGDGVEEGQFREPVGIAYDPESDSFFVADLWNYRIQRFDRNFNPAGAWPVPEWDDNTVADDKAYIAVGPGSVVVVSDPAGKRVWVFTADGDVIATLDVLNDESGLDKPIGVAVDDQARIYVAASQTGTVTRYLPPAEVADAAGIAGQGSDDEAPEGDADAEEPGADDASGAAGEDSGAAGEDASAGDPTDSDGSAGDEGDEAAPAPTEAAGPSPTGAAAEPSPTADDADTGGGDS